MRDGNTFGPTWLFMLMILGMGYAHACNENKPLFPARTEAFKICDLYASDSEYLGCYARAWRTWE